MKSRILSGGALVLAVVLLFAVNMLAGTTLNAKRLDLTENRLYTLSDGTRSVLSKLAEPITLRFYLSRRIATQVPAVNTYAARVEELLEQYERESGGKITLIPVDPEPFSDEEDRAVGYGLQGVPLRDGEDTLYFGLVGTSSTDDEQVISFFSTAREELLEYDLTRLIHDLANPKEPVVGVVSTLAMDGVPDMRMPMPPQSMPPPWVVYEQLSQLFDVRRLGTDFDRIDDDVDVLFIVHPRDLSDRTLYAIDQFVMRGGRALVMVDSHSDAQTVQSAGMIPAAGSRAAYFEKLLSAWGLEVEKDKAVGDMAYALPVRMDRDGRTVAFDYPVWLNLRPEAFDANDPVTAQLANVTLGTPGSLKPLAGATTQFHPLIHTTDQASEFTLDMVNLGADPQDMLRKYKPSGKPYTLMARVTGKARSAFPDGPPAPKAEEGAAKAGDTAAEKPEHLAESKEDINILVIADTDMLMDRFWVNVQDFLGQRLVIPTAANGPLVFNAIDNLLGSSDLIAVRSRGSYLRPFERIDTMRREAELRFREKEQELVAKLEETEKALVALEQRKQGDQQAILSEEQQQELVKFRQERIRVRKELRDVRRGLRSSIESLEGSVKFANIGLVPLLIAAGGIGAGLWRVRRRRGAASRAD